MQYQPQTDYRSTHNQSLIDSLYSFVSGRGTDAPLIALKRSDL